MFLMLCGTMMFWLFGIVFAWPFAIKVGGGLTFIQVAIPVLLWSCEMWFPPLLGFLRLSYKLLKPAWKGVVWATRRPLAYARSRWAMLHARRRRTRKARVVVVVRPVPVRVRRILLPGNTVMLLSE